MPTKNKLTKNLRFKQQPDGEERARLLYKLYDLQKSQKYLSTTFKRTPQQIQQAFNGSQPTLMNKIKKHIELLITRSNNKQISQA